MSTVVAILQARPERADEVARSLTELAARASGEPGALAYRVHRRDGDRFVVYERYEDAAARDAHFAAEPVVALLARFPELLVADPVVEFVDEIAGFERR